ncbi:MAG: aldo/keto reductase [Planctomycetes bacterium]|uniref:aldo/keto reductase n=1 Tax=Candidatus Wunengus sp. YC65 TaxID=3367701 RepID=UPI001D73E3AF|nr:aldo/keto reductase [Planctomycetota bacterium]
MNNRLIIGTVQFGLPYGISNQYGQVSLDEAAAILGHAWAEGVNTLDTAIAYGESEQRLGQIGVGQWRVISKLPAIPANHADVAAWVQESALGALQRLRIPKLHGLLLHRSQQLMGTQGGVLYRALVALKEQGKVEKIGVSIYSPEELDALWPYFQIDIVQSLPIYFGLTEQQQGFVVDTIREILQ